MDIPPRGETNDDAYRHGDVLSADDSRIIDIIDEHYRVKPGVLLAMSEYQGSHAIELWIARLQSLFSGSDEVGEAAVEAAVHFGLYMSSLENDGTVLTPQLDELIQRVGSDSLEKEHEVIAELAAEYMLRHVRNSGIVQAFMGELDPTDEYAETVEVIFGFVMSTLEGQSDQLSAASQQKNRGSDTAFDDELILMMLEKEMTIDLADTRDSIVDSANKLLPSILHELKKELGRTLDLRDTEDVKIVSNVLREVILHRWDRFNDAPLEGDTVIVSGKGIYMPFYPSKSRADTSGFECDVIGEHTELRGTFTGFDVQPYINAKILELDSLDQNVQSDDYVEKFGLHFVLKDVVITNGDEDYTPAEFYYIPLHYPDMKMMLVKSDEAIPPASE